MRYGLRDQVNWQKGKGVFPVQSSVLDEEVLLTEIVKDFQIPTPESCRFLSRGDSDIYRVKTSTKNYYLKIYRPPHTLEMREAEASFVWALSESGIEVVKPVHRTDGTFGCQVAAPEGERPMLLFEEAPPPLPKDIDRGLASFIGESVASFHRSADSFNSTFGLPEVDTNAFFEEKSYYIQPFITGEERSYLEGVSMGLKEYLQRMTRNSPEYGLCHADLVMSNIRLADGGLVTLFDFGNAFVTWRAFEFATIYWSMGHRYKEDRGKLWESFLQGYHSIRPLPKALTETLPAMLVMRQIGFLGGNCATLPLRLGTEPLESGFIEREMKQLEQLVEHSTIMDNL